MNEDTKQVEYTDPEHLMKHNYGSIKDYQMRSTGWEVYNSNPTPLVEWYLDEVFQSVPLANMILDAGCGLGRFALGAGQRVSKQNGKIEAIDISNAMVSSVAEESRQRQLPVTVKQGSVQSLPYGPDTFDVVFCNYVLYHVDDIRAALGEIHRVLKSEGRFFSLVPVHRWLPELIDWQDRALLRMGYGDRPSLFKSTGTDRFCVDTASKFLHEKFQILKSTVYDGSMIFPGVEELLKHYSHSMRFKNIVAAGVPEAELLSEVRVLMSETQRATGELRVSSLSHLVVAMKK